MKIALVDSFPNRPHTAEKEFIRRSLVAFGRLGWEGRAVATSDEVLAYAPDVVLATHEFTPKLTAVPTIGLMWNPPRQIAADPGRMRNLRSYDGYFSGSAEISLFLDDELFAMGKRAPVVAPFAPSCYATAFPEHLRFDGLFYVGANWDGDRHAECLRLLAARVPLRIHGPRDRWTDVPAYAGELPFDGAAVLDALRANGVALCLNRREHSEAGLPSARLFEAAAAGAVAIAEPLPFIREHFGDSVFYIDPALSEADKAEAVATVWERVRGEPRRALEMARAAHAVFVERLCLEKLYAPLPDLLSAARGCGGWAPSAAAERIEVVVPCAGRSAEDIERLLASLAAQTWPNIGVLLAGAEWAPAGPFAAIRAVPAPAEPASSCLWAALAEIGAPYFTVWAEPRDMHPNHLASLMAAIDGGDLAVAGAVAVERRAGRCVEAANLDASVGERREIADLDAPDRLSLLLGERAPPGGWLARRDLLGGEALADPRLGEWGDDYLYLLLLRRAQPRPTWRPTVERPRTDAVPPLPPRVQARLRNDAVELVALRRLLQQGLERFHALAGHNEAIIEHSRAIHAHNEAVLEQNRAICAHNEAILAQNREIVAQSFGGRLRRLWQALTGWCG